MKLLFHVQHLLGIGHHRRAERLARGLVQAGFAVTVACGGPPVAGEDWGGAERAQLPAAHMAGMDFGRLLDQDDRPVDDGWRTARRDALLALFAARSPDIVMLEGFPFARRQLRFELLPLLEAAWAATPRPLIVTSLRDILVTKPDPARQAGALALARDRFDRILVHGDPGLVRLEATLPGAARLADRIAYTGFVAAPPVSLPPATTRDGVLVSVGGGAVGVELLLAACAAKPRSRAANRPWLLITGPMMADADAARVIAAAGDDPGLTVARHRADLPALMAQAELSISQAGYNTVLEALAGGPRLVLVPFAAAGETEQTLRAELLTRAGRAHWLAEADLGAAALADVIDKALAAPPPLPLPLLTDGAARSAAILRADRERML